MSLYLKYRPQDFQSLVGQDFVRETLSKAIEDDKTVGAYLFTGPRGTGKTSTARIFAKAMNCLNPNKGNPCFSCDICNAFFSPSLLSLIELSAASHTWVDNIREIIEKAQFQPTKTKYKVYIIDEVHMLSKGAFNALLKILEEPPVHVKFILATTEIHKVPETILSRCQRYDFKNISPKDMRKRLQFVAKSEQVTIDDDSLDYIIKVSGGGLRNALSLFEQLIVDNGITYTHIEETLGISEEARIEEFLDMLLAKDSSAFQELQKLQEAGKNVKLFFKDLLLFGKDRAIDMVTEWKNIESILHVLYHIEEAYIKSKSSVDEVSAFTIGMLCIFGGTPQKQQNKQETNTPVKQKKKEEKHIKPQEEAKTKNTVNVEDVADVFWFDIPSETAETVSEPTPSSIWESVDMNALVTEVKKLWGKAALTMSLRWATLTLSGNALTLHAQNTIAKNTFSLADNTNTIIAAMEQLWHDNISLTIA